MAEFLDLGAPVLAACAAAMIAGGVVKGVVGIGLPLVALPVMVNFIPVHKAIALLILSSFATSVWQSHHGGQFTPAVKRFWPMLIGIAIGVAISVKALTTFDIKMLYLILGVIVIFFASAGVVPGTWLRRHINEDTFLKMLAVVLFLIGLNLIRRAVF